MSSQAKQNICSEHAEHLTMAVAVPHKSQTAFVSVALEGRCCCCVITSEVEAEAVKPR